MFIYYNPEVALQFVNDLIEEPSVKIGGSNMNVSNAIDKETKHLAMRIKKSTNFKFYKAMQANAANGKLNMWDDIESIVICVYK